MASTSDKAFEEALKRIVDLIIMEAPSATNNTPAWCVVTNLVSGPLNVDPELGAAAASGLSDIRSKMP